MDLEERVKIEDKLKVLETNRKEFSMNMLVGITATATALYFGFELDSKFFKFYGYSLSALAFLRIGSYYFGCMEENKLRQQLYGNQRDF